ncbi:Holliday junction branch migration DNA helicase RuvB [candidate division WOR-3 bacterium JGI_Cruoil_03_44_89]|uniref:Holliday junction branch migration complex subunit RuvB n=1 Tax=candidate division WOR-3 bacterium JGI_Cruoil_03_44_89 TaxID=1973748 RepID=A0A235BN98_UNCW3|nr:MAG: Holliday junction branch migration DNA helicase RuvB [candidate division WOR-3 bacterium JGI_Cruoil_03_44_89]
MKKENITTPFPIENEREVERALRPKTLGDFVGQNKLKENLKVFIEATRRRGEPLDHILFYGPPGLGKTTLAYIVGRELGTDIIATSGPALERPADLAGVLTRLKNHDILFVDEIHRLGKVIEEYLYPAMEDFSLDILLDSGPNARCIKLKLSPFTLVGATTRSGLLSSPLRSRFDLTFRLDFYAPEELSSIVKRSASLLGVEITEDASLEIARRARGTPRIANRLLKRVRDYAEVKGEGKITNDITQYALSMLDVDDCGLDEMDKKILMTIIKKYDGGPVGLSTLAASIGEEEDTISEVFEPYLLQEGFIKRTPRGREATSLAYRHFGIVKRGQSTMELQNP